MKIGITAVFLVLIAISVNADDDNALRVLLDEFLAGASINDAAIHDRFWSENLIYTSSSGERFGKAAIMSGLSDDTNQPETGGTPVYSAEDVTIRHYGETAVVTFRLVAEGSEGESSEYFNTGVFRREETLWKAVAWQATRVAAIRD